MSETSQYSSSELRNIAKFQKIIIWLFLPYALSIGLPPLLTVVLWVAIVPFIYKLAAALKLAHAWAYAVAALIPIVGLFSWIGLIVKATKALKSAGIRVGLVGARKADLDKLASDAA